MNCHVFLGIITGLLSGAFLDGCSEDPLLPVATGISVQDQQIHNNTVIIRRLGVGTRQAWVAIYRDGDNGGPNMSERLGLVMATEGYINDFAVALDRSAAPGDTLWGIMHDDDGIAGAFEYGPNDSTDHVMPGLERRFAVLP